MKRVNEAAGARVGRPLYVADSGFRAVAGDVDVRVNGPRVGVSSGHVSTPEFDTAACTVALLENFILDPAEGISQPKQR